MFCSYCKAARMANEAPCSNCGAPSPLLNAQPTGWGAGASEPLPWGGPGIPASQTFGGQWEQQAPQMPANNGAPADRSAPQPWQQPSGQFDQNSMPAWQQPSGQLNPMSPSLRSPSGQLNPMPAWQQPSGQLEMQNGIQDATAQQSMLPVPYRGGMELQPAGRQSTISLQLIPQQSIEHLLPAEPFNPDIIHVPPTFTKPRPIVPTHRVISGFLSVLIVALLLCSGTGYYVKVSGTWDKLVSLYTGKSVQNIQTSSEKIPDPPPLTAKDFGPAKNIIPSVSMALNIDANYQPVIPQKIFKPNQNFYLTFSVQPLKGTSGHVIAKWYTNNQHYMDTPYDKVIKYDPVNVDNFSISSIPFPNPTSGMVELYWNNVFAQRYYFAIRN